MRSSLAAKTIATLATAAAVLVGGTAGAQDSPPGTIKFVGKNQGFTANGQFNSWKFTKVDIPGGDIEKGTVEIEVDIASVEVPGTDRLTNHLKQNDMFDAAKFPKATVKIHSAKKSGDAYEAQADVKIRDISKTYPVKFTVQSQKPLKVKGEATVDRTAHTVYTPYDPANPRSVEPSVAITIEATLPEKL